MPSQLTKIKFFHRPDTKQASFWKKKITQWLKINFPAVKTSEEKPQVIIALGGDGTVLEACRKFHKINPLIVGLNLGNFGFLSTARDTKKFIPALLDLFNGKYQITQRMMLVANVVRNNKIILKTCALNEIVIENLTSIVEIEAAIDGHPIRHMRGSGVLVATATGSTGFNISAHGPIVMPDIKCFILTELFDHGIPTPSIVIKRSKKIALTVSYFRPQKSLTFTNTGEEADVALISDGQIIGILKQGDKIIVSRSPHLARFVEVEHHYFFKSIQKKFSVK